MYQPYNTEDPTQNFTEVAAELARKQMEEKKRQEALKQNGGTGLGNFWDNIIAQVKNANMQASPQSNTQEQNSDTNSTAESPANSTPSETDVFKNGKSDKYTANYEGINMDEANKLANETILNQIRYGQPIEKMRMTGETIEGMNYARGLRNKAMNQDLLGTKLSQLGNISDAARYAGQSAASAAAGAASMAGGDVASDKITAGKVSGAVNPIYGQMAQQKNAVEQQYQQNQFAQNQLAGANNTDMVSHSNTREYISHDNPLKPLIDKMAMEQAAMNFLKNKKTLSSKDWNVTVNNTQEGA